jgi:hypothetical protein
MQFRWNLAQIRRDYLDACRETGQPPMRLVHPPVARPRVRRGPRRPRASDLRPTAAAAAPPLPPDVFDAIVDALATALVADVRAADQHLK